MASILTAVKKMLGIDAAYTHFDADIILNINTVLFSLNQLGIGTESVFAIEDATAEWEDFFGDATDLNAVKTYIYLKVRLLFDPPSSSFVIDAIERQIKELEWRLYVHVDPPNIDEEEEVV